MNDKIRVVIHSTDRDTQQSIYNVHYSTFSNSGSNFVYRLDDKKLIIGFYLRKIIIPHSWFHISLTKENNTIRITDSGATPATITIPNSSPSASNLASTLDTLFKAVEATFSVTFDADTGKYKIDNTAGAFSILWTDPLTGNNAAKMLGFDGTTDDTGLSTYTSDNIANLTDFYINLHSQHLGDFVKNNHYSAKKSSHIYCIPVNVDFGGFIVYEPFNFKFNFKQPIDVQDLDFYLTDENEKVIDLNGLDILVEMDFIKC